MRCRLVFREHDYTKLREKLLRSENEETAFLYAGIAEGDNFLEFLVSRILYLTEEKYITQRVFGVTPTSKAVLDSFQTFKESRLKGYIICHSHPFSEYPSLSAIDKGDIKDEVGALNRFLKHTDAPKKFFFVNLVVGQKESGIQGEVFDSKGNKTTDVSSVKIVGKSGIKDLLCVETTVENTKDIDKEVFDRNIRWLGEDGQKKLAKTHLGICGVGGVGSYAALIATGLGFRKFTIIDGDAVEASNLNRLPGLGRRHIGVKKVEAVAEMLSSQSLGLETRLIRSWVQDKEARMALKEVDIMLSCVDNNRARLELQTLAARYLKPLLDFGTEIHLDSQKDNVVASMGGQIRFYVPGGACLVCQGLDPARIKSPRQEDVERLTGYVRGKNETPPSVNIINAMAASLGLELLTRYITGFATSGFHERFDLMDFSFRKISFPKRPECLICGDDGAEGRGDLEEYNREPEKASFPEPFREDRHIGYKTDILNRIQQVILSLVSFLIKRQIK